MDDSKKKRQTEARRVQRGKKKNNTQKFGFVHLPALLCVKFLIFIHSTQDQLYNASTFSLS